MVKLNKDVIKHLEFFQKLKFQVFNRLILQFLGHWGPNFWIRFILINL